MACWSCERSEGSGLFCQACGVILPPGAGRTHFDVLGVAQRYDLDAGALEARYKELSRKLHPDRFARADARARRFSLEHATAVNDAYRVLREPVRRAEYLLRLAGVALDVDKGGAGAASVKVDPAFLTEMLEIQETLGEAKLEGRAEEVERIATQIRQRRDEDLRGVEEDFRSAQRGAYVRIGERLARLRYYGRVLVEVAGREETL